VRFSVLGILITAKGGAAQAADEVVAWVGATVFDATSEDAPLIPDAVLLVRDGKIEAIGPRDAVAIPDDARVVDISGCHVVPGLIDAHVHFFQSGGLYTRPDGLDLREKRSYEWDQEGIRRRLDGTFRRYLASGVTAVVDVGGPFWNFEVRDRAAASQFAPRVAIAGPLISTVSRPQLDLGDPPIVQCNTPDAARELVRKQVERDTDLIKIWFIVSRDRPVEEMIEIATATIEEAHAHGVRVAVHATQLEAARAVIEAGADILVHSVDDQPVDDAFVALLRDRGTIYTTTFVVHEGYSDVFAQDIELLDIERRLGDPAVIVTWDELAPMSGREFDSARAAQARERVEERVALMQRNLKSLRDGGVIVAAGTDAGNIGTLHGPSIHRELELMAAAGLSPAQVLVAAMRDAAKVFAEAPEFGTIEPGKRADFLVLDGDPLADLANLQRIRWVVKEGEALRPDEILAPSAAEIVQRQVDAYNARDIDSFANFYSPDAELFRFPEASVFARGRDEIRRSYGEFFVENPELHCTILSRTASGDFIIDRELITGLTGEHALIRGCAIYEVRDGVIRRVWFLPPEAEE
jgi:imidazolonepropionase-like amidohydrolase